MKNIYIVISQTYSVISRIISKVTGDKYAHVSISLEENLEAMYSFGRRHPAFPFPGGFVKESPHTGTLKRFPSAIAAIVEISVSDKQYEEIKDYILQMYENRKQYHYNYIGCFFAGHGHRIKRNNAYYCSEFVKDILERFGVVDEDQFKEVARPVEFMNIRRGRIIYQGKLCEYAGS